MNVVSPFELKEKILKKMLLALRHDSVLGEIPATLGNYGHIHYGNEIIGKLHYPETNTNGCLPFTKEMFRNDPLFDEPNDRKPIALLDHGGCTHVIKTWNAQVYGMKGAVIIDDYDKDFAAMKESESKRTADAKKGYQLNIPYLKVHYENGDILRKYL